MLILREGGTLNEQSPHIRRLLWLGSAPSLVQGEDVFAPSDSLDAKWRQQVRALADDKALMAWLDDCATSRLGRYFEALYLVLCERVLAWRVLANNLPIRSGSRTLGELDILVENRQLNRVEHHEVAVKFYLGTATQEGVRWVGPNRRDRLDLKISRMREHQMTLAQTPEAIHALAKQNLPAPAVSRLVMLGQLFVPCEYAMQSRQSDNLQVPSLASGVMARSPLTGDTANVTVDPSESFQNTLARLPTCYWHAVHRIPLSALVNSVVVGKSDWLGTLPNMANPAFANTKVLVDTVEMNQRAELLARLTQGSDGLWREAERFFLVPKNWPHNLP